MRPPKNAVLLEQELLGSENIYRTENLMVYSYWKAVRPPGNDCWRVSSHFHDKTRDWTDPDKSFGRDITVSPILMPDLAHFKAVVCLMLGTEHHAYRHGKEEAQLQIREALGIYR